MAKVQQEIHALVKKHKSLELDSKTQASELAAALESAKAAKAEAQKALQEIEAIKKIAAGKAFIMQSKHVKVNYLLLTRVRSSLGAFTDLPRSASAAAAYFSRSVRSAVALLSALDTASFRVATSFVAPAIPMLFLSFFATTSFL